MMKFYFPIKVDKFFNPIILCTKIKLWLTQYINIQKRQRFFLGFKTIFILKNCLLNAESQIKDCEMIYKKLINNINIYNIENSLINNNRIVLNTMNKYYRKHYE